MSKLHLAADDWGIDDDYGVHCLCQALRRNRVET